jgi:hypothetical protein
MPIQYEGPDEALLPGLAAVVGVVRPWNLEAAGLNSEPDGRLSVRGERTIKKPEAGDPSDRQPPASLLKP